MAEKRAEIMPENIPTDEIRGLVACRMAAGMAKAVKERFNSGPRAAAETLAASQRETVSWLYEIGQITLDEYAELMDEVGRGYDDYLKSAS